MQYRRNSFHRAERSGYVLLLVLVIILVLGMLFYYSRMHGSVYQIGKGESNIEVPWRQWHAIFVRTKKGRPPGLPNAEQPQLTKALVVVAKPVEEEQQRGQLELFIFPDGSVRGRWAGQFVIKKDVDFQVMGCQFNGQVDPEHIYSDEQGDDPSKLFFITKGPFTILETNDDSGRVRSVTGHIYVRGWLGLDNTIEGEIILTSDEKRFYLYTWKGKVREGGFLLGGLGL